MMRNFFILISRIWKSKQRWMLEKVLSLNFDTNKKFFVAILETIWILSTGKS